MTVSRQPTVPHRHTLAVKVINEAMHNERHATEDPFLTTEEGHVKLFQNSL